MPEPFKNFVNKNTVENMAKHFRRHWPKFNARGFVAAVMEDLESLELKARTEFVTEMMIRYLPDNFEHASEILLASLGAPLEDDLSAASIDNQGIAGWAVMSLVHYVALRGHDHFDLSMNLFKEMTKRASAEFGIRFFLLKSPKKTLSVLKSWTTDDNQHVRRLVSEGTRPRLPWAMQLPAFIKDPSPVIALLNKLKDDNKEYVRRSVANNLNDIAKDHPDRVAEIAAKWMKGASPERRKLVRHACRTLIKNGHRETLNILGYKAPKIKVTKLDILTPKVKFGDALQFTLSITSNAIQDQALVIDYVIHHQKANGTTSPKVFKWRTVMLSAKDALSITKKHAMKKVTTRVYYPGLHTLEIMVNGTAVGKGDFQLLMP